MIARTCVLSLLACVAMACSSEPPATSEDASADKPASPDVVTSPDVIAQPDVITSPDVIAQPDVITPPDVIAQPDVIVRPDVIAPPDVITSPDVVAPPDVTPPRDVVVTPDVTVVDVPRDVSIDAPRDVVVTPDAPDASAPLGSAVLTYQVDFQRTGANRAETQLTPAALRAGRLARDTAFAPSLTGSLYSQPLYVSGLTVGGARRDVLFVATEGNVVFALDALTGATLWRTPLGATVARAQQSCGNIDPIGVTGTPVIDAATRTLYAVSFTSDAGLRFRINALDLTTGMQRAGYPADILPPPSNGSTFDERVTGQRGALTLRGSQLYVPFGGLYGDCGIYHGWVVSIDTAAPTRQRSFATPGRGSGVWAPAGPAQDSAGRLFVATGNSTPLGGSTPGSLGEFVLRVDTTAMGPTHTMGSTVEEFSPTDARNLDLQDLDIGSVSPVLLPGLAGGAQRLIQGGKAGVVYLLDGTNLGGSTPVFTTRIATGGIFGAMAAWAGATESLAFVPTRGTRAGCTGSNGVMALRVTPSGLTTAWCTASIAAPNPPAISSNGANDAILWVTGASTGVGATASLRAYEISTGMEVYANTEPPPSARQWVPPVVVDGRVYITGASTVSMYRLR